MLGAYWLYLLCAMCAAMMNSALLSTVSFLLSVMCVLHGTGDRLYATCNFVEKPLLYRIGGVSNEKEKNPRLSKMAPFFSRV